MGKELQEEVETLLSAIEHNARGGYSTEEFRKELLKSIEAAVKAVYQAGLKVGSMSPSMTDEDIEIAIHIAFPS